MILRPTIRGTACRHRQGLASGFKGHLPNRAARAQIRSLGLLRRLLSASALRDGAFLGCRIQGKAGSKKGHGSRRRAVRSGCSLFVSIWILASCSYGLGLGRTVDAEWGMLQTQVLSRLACRRVLNLLMDSGWQLILPAKLIMVHLLQEGLAPRKLVLPSHRSPAKCYGCRIQSHCACYRLLEARHFGTASGLQNRGALCRVCFKPRSLVLRIGLLCC